METQTQTNSEEIPEIVVLEMQEKFYNIIDDLGDSYEEIESKRQNLRELEDRFKDKKENLMELARFLDRNSDGTKYEEIAESDIHTIENR